MPLTTSKAIRSETDQPAPTWGRGGILSRHAWDTRSVASDLTVRLARYPEGERIALDGEARCDRRGRGAVTTRMYDGAGAFAITGQTLFLDRAPASP